MEEGLLDYFIQRLSCLLEENQITSVEDQILKLKSKLDEIKSSLGDVDRREDEEAFSSLVQRLGDAIHSLDDHIDTHIIQMHDSRDGDDRSLLTSHLKIELEKIEAHLAEIADKINSATQFRGKRGDRNASLGAHQAYKKSPAVEEDEHSKRWNLPFNGGEESCFSFESHFRNLPYYLRTCLYCFLPGQEKEINPVVDEEDVNPSISLELSYRDLPYYLKTCLMYCCIFPDHYWIPKRRLVRLLVAEGLTQERKGEVAEDIAEENIEQLTKMGMLRPIEEHNMSGTKFKVADQYRILTLQKMDEENFITSCTDPNTFIPLTARRVSVHDEPKNVPPSLNCLRIRSLFMFGIRSLPESTWWDSMRTVLSGVRFLRVLDLEDLKIKSLPDEVGELIHLKYLSLKNSEELDELPESLGNLLNLQTLDIRGCGKVLALPSGISNLRRLRHLKMFKNIRVNGDSGVRVPPGVGRLRSLLTLTGLYAGGSIAEELSSLIQLRELRVENVSEQHASKLYDSITMNMAVLLSLSLEAETNLLPKQRSMQMKMLPYIERFTPPSLLRKLRLEGRLEKIPNWFGSLDHLTKLRLGYSNLCENPASLLQLLPNLKHLTLWHAHDARQIGREFCKAGGFPKLESLIIASYVLEEWTELEEGAMPSLKYLHFNSCLKLRMLPEGLQYVTTLQHLFLMPLLDDHEQRLTPNGGQENYKIKHVPEVHYITNSMLRPPLFVPPKAQSS